jgi:pyrimidine-specific ribonucleoside hydrolase
VRATDVVLDVDTGVDDALALLLAVRAPGLALRAVTCVAGNAGADQVVTNTCRVLDAAGAAPDLPVARGATRPLVAAPRRSDVHGADGLADLGLPEPSRAVADTHAVDLLGRVLGEAGRPVTLVCLGPLTNVALLARVNPEALACADRVVVMGGAVGAGNATPSAEFNVWQDPEAAAVVLGEGLPLTLYGLDVFHAVTVAADDARALASADDPGRRLAGRLLLHQAGRTADGAAGLGDAGALASVLAPDGLRTARCPVRVELAGRWTRGRTVVDTRPTPGLEPDDEPAAEADVAVGVDSEGYARLFLDALGAPAGTGSGVRVSESPAAPPRARSAPPPPG